MPQNEYGDGTITLSGNREPAGYDLLQLHHSDSILASGFWGRCPHFRQRSLSPAGPAASSIGFRTVA